GYAGANNGGIVHALEHGADYVLVLNNDTIVDNSLLSELVTVAESDPQVGIVGPMIFYYADPDRIWYFADRQYRLLPFPRGLQKGKKYEGRFDAPMLVDYVSTCAMLIKKQVLQDVGMFQERLFWYYEDPDFCCRARSAGYRIVAVPSARMWHKVSLTAKKAPPFARYLRTRNRVIFYKQHPHGPHPVLTHIYLALDSVRVGALDLWRRDVDLLAPLVLGLYDGYCGNWDELRYAS
ncbi:MAG: glycosyltransferase family 2 protein, partial [Anaerolineae bacterium]